jgi:hypothetical protein
MFRNVDLETRHPSVREIAQFFAFDHLPDDLAVISGECGHLANVMLDALPDSPELTVGLRKLLEAKDCFVRAAVAARP